MILSSSISMREKLFRQGLPVSCFGKLPVYRDFIRAGGTTDSLAEYAKWLDRAFGYRWDDLDGRGESVDGQARMLFTTPKQGTAICAVLRNSTDQGGLRGFPFALFTELPVKVIDPKSPSFAINIAPVWEALKELMAEAAEANSIDALYSLLRGKTIQPRLPGDDDSPFANMDQSEFASALRREGHDLPGLLYRIAGTIAQQKKGGSTNAKPWAWRLPLAKGFAPELQIGTWTRLLVRSYSKLPSLPGVVIPNKNASWFCLVFRPMNEKDSRLLSKRISQAENLYDLTVTGNESQKPPVEFVTKFPKRISGDQINLEHLAKTKLPVVKHNTDEVTP